MSRYYTETIPATLAKKLKEKEINIPSIAKYIIGNQVRHYDRDYDGDMSIIGTREYHDGDLIKFGRIDEECNPMCCNAPTYAEVFDWLMSKKGVFISGFRRFDTWRWAYATEWRFRIELEDISQEEVNGYMVNGNTWHEAADAAINKALELVTE